MEILARFAPLRDLPPDSLANIAYCVKHYAPGAQIFVMGEAADSVPYLLQGEIRVQPNGAFDYEVAGDSVLAHLPLNSGRLFGSTAVAKTRTLILCFSGELVQQWVQSSRQAVSCLELVDISLPEPLADSRFFNNFAQAYRENKLQLPTLPDVAIRLKDAMQRDIGVAEATEIIQLDAAIVSKLIQVANSPLYASVAPITNCHDAVARLGLEPTRNLVMSISLKQLFRTDDKDLKQGMHALWRNSILVSSLSFVLAQECGGVNPDDALLAGLIADIGVIPLLHFAEASGDHPDFAQIQSAIPFLRGPVGTLVLHTLGFPEQFHGIPSHAQDWFHESDAPLGLIDVVIVAKLHSLLGTPKAAGLPLINTIPAYAKLKDGKLDPDFSLTVLQKGKQRIHAAMDLLA